MSKFKQSDHCNSPRDLSLLNSMALDFYTIDLKNAFVFCMPMTRTSDKSSSENQGAEWSQEDDILQKLRQWEYSGSTTHIYDLKGGNHDRMVHSKDRHNWFERRFLQCSGWNLMASNARTCFYTLRSLHSDEPTMRAHILYHICTNYPGKPTLEQNSNPHAPWLVMDLCPQNVLGRKLLCWNVVSERISASRDVSFGSWWSQEAPPYGNTATFTKVSRLSGTPY